VKGPRAKATAKEGFPASERAPASATVASFVRDAPGGALLEVLVSPRASTTRVTGEHERRLKIALAAPPVDGEANAALIAFLSEVLKLRKAEVVILRGASGRRKTVRVMGRGAAAVASALAAVLPKDALPGRA
jgi:uncharacterized protein